MQFCSMRFLNGRCSRYLSYGSFWKEENGLVNSGFNLARGIPSRVCDYRLKTCPRYLIEFWNLFTRTSTTSSLLRTTPVSNGLSCKRPHLDSCKRGFFGRTISGKNDRSAIVKDDDRRPLTLIDFFRSNTDVLETDIKHDLDIGDLKYGKKVKEMRGKGKCGHKQVEQKKQEDIAKVCRKKVKQVGQKKQEDIVKVRRKKVKQIGQKKQEDIVQVRQKKVKLSVTGDGRKQKSRINGTDANKKTRIKGADAPRGRIDAKPFTAGLLEKEEMVGSSVSGAFAPLYPPDGKSVVIVETDAKAKMIQRYLGDMFVVISTNGHVRDLAGRSGSVRPDDDFSMVWEVPASSWTQLKAIKVALSGAKNLILATDPDREGEAIAWHLTELLKQQDALSSIINVARVVFYEITDAAIKEALQSPRDLDLDIINAYLARRALNYLTSFNISPLLSKKLLGCRSPGRVQSAALALICDRAMEINLFKPQEYWTVEAEFCKSDTCSMNDGATISSLLTHLDFKKMDRLSLLNQVDAESVKKRLISEDISVLTTRKSKIGKNPSMPYTTSTLLQDAASKLHFTAAETMKLAQKLYEGVILCGEQSTGLITYMRTDGPHVSNVAATDIVSLIRERYGDNFASKVIRKYFKKVKNAREAHEAIRPTNIRRLPSTLKGILDDDSLKLYTLIWTRTVACQMEAAVYDQVNVEMGNRDGICIFRSSALRINFLGYQAIYKDPEAAFIPQTCIEMDAEDETFEILSLLKKKEPLRLSGIRIEQHRTEPPKCYSEGTLIKRFEELGIGRPSSYASILEVLQERGYATVKNRVLQPEFRGHMVSGFLSHYFMEVSDYRFIADIENQLDNVSVGLTDWRELVKEYWDRFSKHCDLTSNTSIPQVEKMLERKFEHLLCSSLPTSSRTCPRCLEGTLTFKLTKLGMGYFIGCDRHPNCRYIADSASGENVDINDDADLEDRAFNPGRGFEPRLLGYHPGSNEKVFFKNGFYGYYVQLGEFRNECPPKRVIVKIKDKDIDSFTLEDAIEYLRYPVTLGLHPDDQYPVMITYHRSGTFFVRHKNLLVPLPKNKDPKTITFDISMEMLSKEREGT